MSDYVKFLIMIAMWSTGVVGVIKYDLVQTQATDYKIQMDARTIRSDILGRGNINRLMKQGDADWAVSRDLFEMIGLYLIVYRQAQAGMVSSKLQKSYIKDFCGFVKSGRVAGVWRQLETEGIIGDEHTEMRTDWCGKEQTQ